ncbi:hypothetical protein O181_040999 [Austropuccinia psidii MF-1]|uniref:Secreted protein n=1 Tax=Austropuccinia psidii MF-1 TaxID=1389203 RepID=A0A9Q3DDK0_9BASI|nr:hypothetical protein [Austropuccinia psidii MF-1]
MKFELASVLLVLALLQLSTVYGFSCGKATFATCQYKPSGRSSLGPAGGQGDDWTCPDGTELCCNKASDPEKAYTKEEISDICPPKRKGTPKKKGKDQDKSKAPGKPKEEDKPNQ